MCRFLFLYNTQGYLTIRLTIQASQLNNIKR